MKKIGVNKRNIPPFKACVRSLLPVSVGLGSSGAFSVGLAATLLQAASLIPPPSVKNDSDGALTWREPDLETIRKWASMADALIHSRASGLDAAICTYGGIVSYKIGDGVIILPKTRELDVLLVNSVVQRNTLEFVKKVKEKMDLFPEKMEEILNEIEQISVEAEHILRGSTTKIADGGDIAATESDDSVFDKLNKLTRANHRLLTNQLGVGHRKLEEICAEAAKLDIFLKITGAGGGGCVFGFVKPDLSHRQLDALQHELKCHGFEVFRPTLGGRGVMGHSEMPTKA